MNQTQFMPQLRQLITLICGYFVGRGWISENTAMFIVSLVLALSSMAWTFAETTKASMITKVNAMPEVAGVITNRSVAGLDMASSVGKVTVATAGTQAAADVVNK